MKKLTLLCLIALTHAHTSFGMLIKTSTRKLASHKPIKSFHTTPSARFIDPLGVAAFTLSIWNTIDIYDNKTSLESRIQELETTIKQNEEKYNLALKIEQHKKITTGE